MLRVEVGRLDDERERVPADLARLHRCARRDVGRAPEGLAVLLLAQLPRIVAPDRAPDAPVADALLGCDGRDSPARLPACREGAGEHAGDGTGHASGGERPGVERSLHGQAHDEHGRRGREEPEDGPNERAVMVHGRSAEAALADREHGLALVGRCLFGHAHHPRT